MLVSKAVSENSEAELLRRRLRGDRGWSERKRKRKADERERERDRVAERWEQK